MKKVYYFFLLINFLYITKLMAQPIDPIKSSWEQVDSLLDKAGQPRSALEKINQIGKLAKKNHLDDQKVKVLLYRINIQSQIEDKDINAAAQKVQAEIAASNSPVMTSLLQALKASLLSHYYRRHLSTITSRTATDITNQSDITTWAAPDFDRSIYQLYQSAMQPKTLLQKALPKSYAAVIISGTARELRPTLYDLILHQALDYFKSTRPGQKAEQPYILMDSFALAPANSFIQHHFTAPDQVSGDSLSSAYLLLNLFKQGLAFHKNDRNPAAFIDLDLERITWAYQKLSELQPNNNDSSAINRQYLQTLSELINNYKKQEGRLEAAYLMAKYYADLAGTYQAGEGSGNSNHQYDYQKALAITRQYLPAEKLQTADAADSLRQPKNQGLADLLSLRSSILAATHMITAEEVNVPGKPFRMLVEYRNTPKLYFRVIRTDFRSRQAGGTSQFWETVIKQPAVTTFEQDLPDLKDYQQHRVEVKVPALKKGAYIILASENPDFQLRDGLSANGLSVSSIAYLQHGQQLFILDRSSGQPVSDAQVHFLKRTYKEKGYQYENVYQTSSNKNGRINLISQLDKGISVQNMEIIHHNDTLVTDTYFYLPYEKEKTGEPADETTNTIHFYTDRSIYRPGQTVYFKAIATTSHSDGRQATLLTDKKPQQIYLYDRNYQKIDSASFVLNAFGSLAGSFSIPQGTLAGNFSLRADDLAGAQSFRVEEYKRPTFHVVLDTLSAEYQLGDSITIHGTALAYSGQPIDNGGVTITVSRATIFPYIWLRGGNRFLPPGYPSGQNSPVAHGQVTTDETGNFTFTFLASEGSKEALASMPNYRFQIEAAVTDINGETRQTTQDLLLGSQPFTVQLHVPASRSSKLLDAVQVFTRNAAGKFVPQTLQLRITALDAPKRLIRERLWQRPDQFVIDSAQFIKWFPHDEYNCELDERSWPQKAVAYQTTIQTTAGGKVAINKELQPGWYLIEASAPGSHKQVIKDQSFVYLYTPGAPTGQRPVYNWSDTTNATAMATETARLQIASSADNVYLLTSRTRQEDGRTVTRIDHQQLHKKPVTLDYTLKSTDSKGAFIDYSFIKDNRLYTGSMQVQLKQAKENFKIDYKTFRDKTAPGQEETWTIQMKRGDKTVQDMELLSAMYDGSLDQFQPHEWTFPPLFQNTFLPTDRWYSQNGFETARSQTKYADQHHYYFNKTYDQLIFQNGIHLASTGGIMVNAMNYHRSHGTKLAVPAPTMIRGANQKMVESAADAVAGESKEEQVNTPVDSTNVTPPAQQRVRSDFKETAFFFPQLQSDANGNYQLNFTMPDALTTWKWMNMAFDKQLHHIIDYKEIISQKTLMVQPGLPRFLRAGDEMTLSAKVSNISSQALSGNAVLTLTDPATGEVLQSWTSATRQAFNVPAAQSVSVLFPVKVPSNFTGPVDISVQATAASFSDGEKRSLPVLTNKQLVTETLPVYLPASDKGNNHGATQLKMNELLQSGDNDQIQNQALVFELNTNPVWYAISALPYLSRSTYDGAEAVFSQYYAHALGSYIDNQYPTIESTFKSWLQDSSRGQQGALSAGLEKNQALKTVLLEQTPWVMAAKQDSANKRSLAKFFDQKSLQAEQKALILKLQQMQSSDGSFSWVNGGSTDIYITQYIASAIGRLKLLDLWSRADQDLLISIGIKANDFLTGHYESQYQLLKARRSPEEMAKYQPTPSELQYLYTSSFYSTTDSLTEAEQFYLEREKQDFQKRSVFLKAMIAATQFRIGNQSFATKTIMPSILETAIQSKTLGMYWKQPSSYYHWYQAPLQTQAMVMTTLQELQKKEKKEIWTDALLQMQRWLILNKQTNHWSTTTSTADACFALLYHNQQLKTPPATVQLTLGDKQFTSDSQEAGTGYFKVVIPAEKIKPEMGNISVKILGRQNSEEVPGYGALYWQYLQPAKTITGSSKDISGLSIEKGLFIQRATAQGTRLKAVTENNPLKVGDKLVVRMIIKSDRPMDYVHLQDLRAAGVEPDQVLSGYKWKDGLGYYETTTDVSADFYFNHLPKGSFILQYPAHVTHKGVYSAGTATLECLYAPAFQAHSKGFGVQVD